MTATAPHARVLHARTLHTILPLLGGALPRWRPRRLPDGFDVLDWFEAPGDEGGNGVAEYLSGALTALAQNGVKDRSTDSAAVLGAPPANDGGAPLKRSRVRRARQPYRPPPEAVAAITDLDRARARKALRAVGCVDLRKAGG